MPKGHSDLPARVQGAEADLIVYRKLLEDLEVSVNSLQRRLEEANQLYFSLGYLPPRV